MAQATLRSLFRESKNRVANRAAFAQAMSRLSGIRGSKDERGAAQKPAKDEQRLPDSSGERV